MNQDGILVINKPAGMTSHDVVHKLRKAYNIKKVGHTGTLDPMVTGVMVVCFGKATKLAQFLIDESKSYRVTIRLGEATDTEDITGTIIEKQSINESDVPKLQQSMEQIITSFNGEYWQTPPMYSALKVAGKKLYEYARKNIEVKREARCIHITEIMYDKPSFVYQKDTQVITCAFDVHASKGLYARTLCVDIGKKLNMPATMEKLVRLASGSYFLTDAYTLNDVLEKLPNFIGINDIILPMPTVFVETAVAEKLKVGYKLPHYFVQEKFNPDEQFAVYDKTTHTLIGIYKQSEKYPDKYQSVRVI